MTTKKANALDANIRQLVNEAVLEALTTFFANDPRQTQPIEDPVRRLVLEQKRAGAAHSGKSTTSGKIGKHISEEEIDDLFIRFIQHNKIYYELGERVYKIKQTQIRGAFAEFVQEVENYSNRYNLAQPFLQKGSLSKFGIVYERYVKDWKIPVEELHPFSAYDLYDLQKDYLTNVADAKAMLKRLQNGESARAIIKNEKSRD